MSLNPVVTRARAASELTREQIWLAVTCLAADESIADEGRE